MTLRSQPYDLAENQPPEQPPRQRSESSFDESTQVTPESSRHTIHKRRDDWGKEYQSKGSEVISETNEEERSNRWLAFMIIGIISSLVLFMMIPFLENFFQNEGTNNALENIKQFISFASPVIVIVCAIAGAAGYFMLKRVAWLTILGFVLGLTIFLFTLKATSQSLNFGIYWIIMGSFFGGFLGSGIEFGYMLKRRIHRELLPLLFIAAFSFFVGGFFLAQSNVSSSVELVSFKQLAEEVDYALYEPAYLPEKFSGIEPKIFINTTGGVSAYYGNDQYPPPPVIDFLTGIELIQSKRVEETDDVFNLDPGTVFVDLGESQAKFSQRRGRATIEWDHDDTHLILNIYSNIPSTEMFKIARTLQPVLEAQE